MAQLQDAPACSTSVTGDVEQTKAALLSNVSHELRTPLNGIVGFAQMLADELLGPIGEEQKEALQDILVSARRLVGMIDDVLALADVTAGRMTFHPRPVVVSRLCGQVRETFGTLESEKRLCVEVSVEPEVEHVVLDPERLTQLLNSFVSNALKFTPEGGHVSVRVTRENASELRVQVRDTGVGIDPQDLGRLFVAFEQLDSGVSKRFQGLGLGLALTKRIVEQQGGRIGVESRLGEGSTFFAVLPYHLSR
jgi:signal transduction histidine kinase